MTHRNRLLALFLPLLLVLAACSTSDTVVVSQPSDQAAEADADAAEGDSDANTDTADAQNEDDSTATDASEPTVAPTTDPEATEAPAQEAATPTPEPEPEPTEAPAASGDDAAVIAAVAEQLRAEGDVPPGVDVDCFANALVTGLGGADGLAQDFGLSVEDIAGGADPGDIELPVEQARTLASGLLDCGLEGIFLQEMAGTGFAEEDGACLLAAIDDEIIRDIMAAQFTNAADGAILESDAQAALFDAMFTAFLECEIDPTTIGG